MKIAIAERLHPFSHQMGTKFLIPHTSWVVQVYPTRLYFSDLKNKEGAFYLSLDFEGPIQEFTAELNLEQNLLHVFGKTQRGYMRYQLSAKEKGIWLSVEKAPQDKMVARRSSEEMVFSKSESKLICAALIENRNSQERLSLGMHKSQDWDLIRRRLDGKEIFPHWLDLSSMIPHTAIEKAVGNFSLLEACRKKIEQGDKVNVLDAFEKLFLAAFEGVLVPRLVDTDYQGIAPEADVQGSSPLSILTESGKLIRSLFIQEKGGVVSLLPCLPTPFHSGRFIHVRTSQNALLSLEWSKKALKKVTIAPSESGEMRLELPKGIRSFRMMRGKGKHQVVEVDAQRCARVALDAGKTVHLDRFLT